MKYYKISEERLLKLLESENELQSLRGAGVDNWDGCDFAFEDYEKITEIKGFEEVE